MTDGPSSRGCREAAPMLVCTTPHPAPLGGESPSWVAAKRPGEGVGYPAVALGTKRLGITTGGVPGTKAPGSAIILTISAT